MLSIRMRLALGCMVLCDLILLIVGVIGYSFHARGLYNSLDHTLVTSVEHAKAEMVTLADNGLHLSKGSSKAKIIKRLKYSQ